MRTLEEEARAWVHENVEGVKAVPCQVNEYGGHGHLCNINTKAYLAGAEEKITCPTHGPPKRGCPTCWFEKWVVQSIKETEKATREAVAREIEAYGCDKNLPGCYWDTTSDWAHDKRCPVAIAKAVREGK